MRIISIVILIAFLFTNTAYSSTLRVPVGQIKPERKESVKFEVFLSLTEGRTSLSQDKAAEYFQERRLKNQKVLILNNVTMKFEEKDARDLPSGAITPSSVLSDNFYDVYKLKLGESIDKYLQHRYVLVTTPIGMGGRLSRDVAKAKIDSLVDTAGAAVNYEKAKGFGEYNPFSVAQFAEEAGMTTEEAAAILRELRLKGENIEMVRDAKGSIYYQYAPVRLVLQIGPDDRPEDMPPGVDIVVINHSETKEFLGARAEGSNKQIREFIKAGYKVVAAFGDFPEQFEGKDYLILGLRSFPLTFDGIKSKLNDMDFGYPLYDDLSTLYIIARAIRRYNLVTLKKRYGDLIQAFGISDDAISLDDLRANIIAELSTKAEIEREIRDLFKDLTPDEVLYNIYCRAYEPVEGIRTVAISPELAKFRQDYIRQTITDLVIGTGADEETKRARSAFESKLRITYGGGGNVKNIVPLGKTGYRGAFIGRASAKPRAESGKDSTANITEAAAESESRMLTLYNTKSTETKSPNEYFDAYSEKGLDLGRRVEAAHAISFLDFHIWRRARMGEDVGRLFVDASDKKLDVDITIRAGRAEATQGVGAFTRHHASELLAMAGVTQAVIDPTKDYAVEQVENLASVGIAPVILRTEHSLETIESFKKRVGEQITRAGGIINPLTEAPFEFEVPDESYIDSIKVLDDVIITPISEVRNAREALLGEVSTSETARTRGELEQVLRRFSILQAQI